MRYEWYCKHGALWFRKDMSETKIASILGLLAGIMLFAPLIEFDVPSSVWLAIPSLLSGTLAAWLLHFANKKGFLSTTNVAQVFVIPCVITGSILLISLLILPTVSLVVFLTGFFISLVILFPAIEPVDLEDDDKVE